ncbi:MAG: ATPase, T2SS/T4P/T4SS family [Candidatus Bathyarchaeia archaeon]
MNRHDKLLERYQVGPYDILVKTKEETSPEFHYEAKPRVKPESEATISETEESIRKSCLSQPLESIPKFEDLVTTRLNFALSLIHEKLLPAEANAVAQIAAFKSLGLEPIFPFLLDENVEEIFQDRPGEAIYLDHRKWGRCRTDVILSPKEISAIKTRICSESGFPLDSTSPSIKTEMLSTRFQARFSVDIPPLAYDGPHMDIRKLRTRHFTLPELISNGTISVEASAYLYYCLVRRQNICVIGEPSAGKTTLINALDITTLPHWRKLTIEDVVESINQSTLGFHQVRFKVAPIESARTGEEKEREIIKLLHRAPDYIYLGEVQTAAHSRAMFHALSSGLKGLETCHAPSPEQAIRRWVLHHRVPINCIHDLDVIVCMSRTLGAGPQKRRVVRISEIEEPVSRGRVALDESTIVIRDIFDWDPEGARLERACELLESPVVRKISRTESLTNSIFKEEFSAYVDIFSLLSQRRKFSVRQNARIFRFICLERIRRGGLGCHSWPQIVEEVRKRI